MSEKQLVKQIFEQTGMTLLYLAVALLGASVLLGVLIYRFRKEQFDDFKKSLLGVWIGFAVAVIVTMTFLSFKYNAFDASLEHNLISAYLFKPVLSMILIVAIGGVLMFASSFFNKKLAKGAAILTLLGELGAFIATMVYMTRFFNESQNIPGNTNLTGLIVSAVVIGILIVVVYLLGERRKDENNTRALVYGAIAIAMSFALSYIRLFALPQGGSVTFASLLPLLVYCCMFGTRRGVTVCLIYGVLQAIQDPWIIHPMQFLLDYPLAFGVVGVSGLFMEKKLFKKNKVFAFLIGGVVAVVIRYACHVCSGVFAFAEWSGSDTYTGALIYSLSYNSFAFIDMLIALVAGSVLFASKAFNAQLAGVSASGNTEQIMLNDDDDETSSDTVFIETNTDKTSEN